MRAPSQQRLLRRGLLIRPGSDFARAGSVRITVGPVEIMKRVGSELAEAIPELTGHTRAAR